MKEEWVCVFFSAEVLDVKIAEDVLKQNGIVSHIVNKPDSAIPSIGDAELYVPKDEAEAAIKILEEKGVKA